VVSSVEILDEYTLRVRLKESFSPFLTSWGDTYIVPAHILEGVADPNNRRVQHEEPGGHGTLQVREPGGRRFTLCCGPTRAITGSRPLSSG
jgi:ABC-type transport system substrate-binding protein